jgi:hypothetical protein
MKLNCCKRRLAAVLLMSFWKMPLFAEPPTMPPQTSGGSGTRQYVQYGEAELPGKNAEHFYTELEVDTLIEDLTAAAEEAIEQAAAEAARAAMLASLDREMAAARETRRLLEENGALRKSRVKAAVVTGAVCFFGGLAAGVCGVMLIGGIQ